MTTNILLLWCHICTMTTQREGNVCADLCLHLQVIHTCVWQVFTSWKLIIKTKQERINIHIISQPGRIGPCAGYKKRERIKKGRPLTWCKASMSCSTKSGRPMSWRTASKSPYIHKTTKAITLLTLWVVCGGLTLDTRCPARRKLRGEGLPPMNSATSFPSLAKTWKHRQLSSPHKVC